MFNVVLVEPEIPPNTGNVIRLCANTGARLHLIEPLGFPLDDAKMRRAGLDYHEYAHMQVHRNWDAFVAAETPDPARMFAFTTRGSGRFHDHAFLPGDWFVFGAETRGLLLHVFDQIRPLDAIRPAGKVFDQRGDGELPARLVAFEDQRLEVRACSVDGSGKSGAPGAEDDSVARRVFRHMDPYSVNARRRKKMQSRYW